MIKGEFTATLDANGNGGVADLHQGLRQQGIPAEAMTNPKGRNSLDLFHLLTGEHPYGLSQQAGKGVADAGASVMRVPAAVGGDVNGAHQVPVQDGSIMGIEVGYGLKAPLSDEIAGRILNTHVIAIFVHMP